MKRSFLPILFISALVLPLSGCGSNRTRSGADSQVPTSPVLSLPIPGKPSEPTVDFSVHPTLKVGFKYRSVQDHEINSGVGDPLRARTISDHELVAIENDQYKWKRIQNEAIFDMGSKVWLPGYGPDKNRLITSVKDKYGNELSSEGEPSPTTTTEGNEVPNYPVPIGASWRYTRTTNGKETKYEDTLEAITIIDGIKYAVITTRFNGDDTGKGKCWISLDTGAAAKSEIELATTNLAGEFLSGKSIGYVTKPDGTPLLY